MQNESVKSYKLSAIFRYCMEKTNNPNLAFDIGQSIPYQSLGIWGYLLMNAKDLNLASHMKEILDSGAVDSVKIEGRTKTAYYAATTAKAYRMAIDDYYEDRFQSQRYQYELQSLQNRGYTDAYLVSRPFEKNDTQSLDFTMQLGTHQVSGVVLESGTHYMCKYKTFANDEMEIVAPLNSKIKIVDNEIGTTYERDGKLFLKLKQILAENKKVLDSVHSGNTNKIKLPGRLPYLTMFRVEDKMISE